MNFKLISLMLLASGCGSEVYVKENVGIPGSSGSNGHSIVTTNGTLPSVCTNGGSAVDLYLDVDDSLSYTLGDVLQSTVFSCHGTNGTNSTGTVVSFFFPSNTTCQVVGTNTSAKKHSSSGSTVRLYTGTTCAGTHIIELNSTTKELYFLNDSVMYTAEGNNSVGITLRRVTFN